MELNKKTIRYLFLGVLGCIFFYWLLHETERVQAIWELLKGVFSPFVVGGVIAFILNVPMRAFDKLFCRIRSEVLRRILAIFATVLSVVAVIAGVVMLIIPQLATTVQVLMEELVPFLTDMQDNFRGFLQEHPDLLKWVEDNEILANFDWNSIIDNAAQALGSSFSTIVSGAINALGNIASAAFHTVISVVFSFYCLAQKETLARQGRRLLYALCKEKRADFIVRVLRMTNSTFSNFLTGQCLDAVILGLLFAVMMAIFRMPYIPLISVLITVTALVPVVGAFIGCILGAFFILVNNPMQAVGFVVLFLAIQQFEENVIYPRVVGKSVGLPGMWVLLAVAIGGGFWGISGMFLMVPIASVLYSLIREYTHKRLDAKQIDPDKLVEHPPELQPHFRMKAQAAKTKRKAKRQARREEKENNQT